MRDMRRTVIFDATTMREVFTPPAHQWNAYGVVGFNDGEPLFYDEDQGQVLIKVTLHPSFVKVYARLAMSAAGNGEAEYTPFVEGDEVVVAIMEGSERAGCVILGRLNNAIDVFPMKSVAGQDPTLNNFSFRRSRTPRIEEYAGPYLVRNALTSAFFQLGNDGSVTLKDSENSALQLSASVLGLQGPSTSDKSPEFLLQLDISGRHFFLQVGDAVMTLSASDGSPEVNTISVPGAMTLGTLGNPPLEHVITTEASVSLLSTVLDAIAAAFTLIPPSVGGAPGGLPFATAITALTTAGLAPAIAAAGTLSPAALTAIQAKFAASTQKPNTPTGQLAPGIGAAGLLTG